MAFSRDGRGCPVRGTAALRQTSPAPPFGGTLPKGEGIAAYAAKR